LGANRIARGKTGMSPYSSPSRICKSKSSGSIAAAMCATIWVGFMPADRARAICARSSISAASGIRRAPRLATSRQKIAVVVDQAAGAAHRRNRRPAIARPFTGQSQMNAEVERRIRGSRLGNLAEPWARHHDRAATDIALRGQREKTAARAAAHAKIVDVEDHGALDPDCWIPLSAGATSDLRW